MKLKLLIAIFVLWLPAITFAYGKNYTTTNLEMTVQSGSDGVPSLSNMTLLDGRAANLVYYDDSGKPESRLEIKSQKLKPKNNKKIIDLSIKFFEFKEGKWKLSQESSITNYENDLGEISINSEVETWNLSVRASSGETLSKDDLSIKNITDCDLTSNYIASDVSLQFNSPVAGKKSECCSSACADGSGRTMKCCGAIRCCGCGTCCSP